MSKIAIESSETGTGTLTIQAPVTNEDRTLTIPDGDGILGIPAGAIMPFAMATPPAGWLTADGSEVSRTTYATLFAAVGTTWGAGDSSTTFNLPDLREVAPVGIGTRGAGAAADVYTLGQFKDDQGQGHWHRTSWADTVTDTQSLTTAASSTASSLAAGNAVGGAQFGINAPLTDGTNGTPRTGTVTRGKRVGVQYCIKF